MVSKSIRPRGRPRSFDEQEAILRATDVFWAKGFDGVTIDDLVEGMGVHRPSFYAVFQDKSTLFVKCLEAYRLRFGKAAMDAFFAPKGIREAIRTLLTVSVENATMERSPAGCLFVTVAPLVNDTQVRAYLAKDAMQSTEAVAGRFRQAIELGELPEDFPCESRARTTLDLARGLVVRAKIGVSREQLLTDVDEQASLIVS